MRHELKAILIAGAALLATPVVAGTKDDVRDLQARMERAETALSAQSETTVRVRELEQQIQQLTGRIEELDFALGQQRQRLDAITAALAGDEIGAAALSAGGFETGATMGPAPAGPVDLTTGEPVAAASPGASAGSAPSVELPLNPEAAYDYAAGFLLAGEYAKAKAAFKLYTEVFPNHSRTPDAKFRLGEIHLTLGENASAAEVFLDYLKSYPNDPRAAEAHLKLGTALARLDKATQACQVFATLKSKYPSAPTPVMQRANQEMSKLGCR